MYLDRQIKFPECNATPQASDNITATFSVADNRTTFTLPYTVRTKTDIVVRYDEAKNKGLILGTIESGNTIVATIKGDWRTTKLMVGARYPFEYEFTRAYQPERDQARQRIIGKLAGRLQVATWSVAHYQSGPYTLTVKRKNREYDSEHKFSPMIINVQNNELTTEKDLLDTGTLHPGLCSQY